jgi:hypothetical protein
MVQVGATAPPSTAARATASSSARSSRRGIPGTLRTDGGCGTGPGMDLRLKIRPSNSALSREPYIHTGTPRPVSPARTVSPPAPATWRWSACCSARQSSRPESPRPATCTRREMLSAVGVLLVLTVASVSALRTPPDADLTGPAARSHATWASEVLKMRDTMHTMTREEQDRRLAEIKHFGRNLEREHQVRGKVSAARRRRLRTKNRWPLCVVCTGPLALLSTSGPLVRAHSAGQDRSLRRSFHGEPRG